MVMQSRTKKAIQVREYYYKLEKIIFEYNNFTINSLEEKIKILTNN